MRQVLYNFGKSYLNRVRFLFNFEVRKKVLFMFHLGKIKHDCLFLVMCSLLHCSVSHIRAQVRFYHLRFIHKFYCDYFH